MLQRVRRQRQNDGKRRLSRRDLPSDLNPMIGVKLWENPCWLSFRANYIAHHFNQPVYSWIWQRYRLTLPEHAVLYAIGLKDGITADDIAASSARPKNTLSRAVKRLLDRKLIFRSQNASDRRRLGLHLTDAGRAIVDETVPVLVEHERKMFAPLDAAEQKLLEALLTKIILNAGRWPAKVERETRP